MKLPAPILPFFLLLSNFCFSSSATQADAFLNCLALSNDSSTISALVYTPANSTFDDALLYSINNLRFAQDSTPKPLVIITPTTESHIQNVIYCTKLTGLELRIRSGGHSFEGFSYVSSIPFVVLDLRNINKVVADVATATAWVDSGVTNGELYYYISRATSAYGFPSGLWANVGVGGILSGGGYGMLRRKYGLAGDNVIDARLIDANGNILTRATMGEDLFWAIRGGGGGSFGVVVSWKVNLVPVPPVVTIFQVFRTIEQDMTNIFYKWQSVAPLLPKELDIRCNGNVVLSENSTRSDNKTVRMSFESLYLGPATEVLAVIGEQFPELGLVKEDLIEVSYIQAMVFFSQFPYNAPPEILLNKTILPRPAFKGRSDFFKQPMPVEGLLGVWDYMFQLPDNQAFLQYTPFGGRMSEISETALPFPYRDGYLYMFNFFAVTCPTLEKCEEETARLDWVRSLDTYLAPYVTSNPRSAYVNYVNIWIGQNNPTGSTSYAQASQWGKRYFGVNFDRLVAVKSVFDPANFFRHEQSIPVFSLWSDM
ncbi:FAD-binding Berberine family protein [Heracleum sosnowskyi]|uniref:FAD-binding Berberine family protein n=1 Tax=Heracleum sosnowskyi TaxID=360622 RepID=A0AAD8I398_9APIA|nr:FAD-binding Berberine family protein [Heracleum sosnowskyi]